VSQSSTLKKVLYILLDGVGDRPIRDLGGLTPLEAAETPNLDLLARRSVLGRVVTVGQGIAPESDIAVFSMLGYDLGEGYVGRGVVEAIGAGLDFKDGDVALRTNFATVGPDRRIVDRRAGRNLTEEEGRLLAEEITRGVTLSDPRASFVFRHTAGHRGVIILRHSEGLSGRISNTDPAYARIGTMGVARTDESSNVVERCVPLTADSAASRAAELVNEFTEKSFHVLEKSAVNESRRARSFLPANCVLARDAGNAYPKLEELNLKFGLRFGAVVDMPVELGISKLVGLRVYRVPSSGDYSERILKTLQALEENDVVYIHLKGPDEPGHDGLCLLKKEVIERIDSIYLGNLLPRLKEEELVVAVSADHCTPCELKGHSDDPVPLMISGSGLGADGSTRFCERQAAQGSLGMMKGPEVLAKVIDSAK
jgi:2,3-bisphosphoglycerate-independent phosphoglycerate mutase